MVVLVVLDKCLGLIVVKVLGLEDFIINWLVFLFNSVKDLLMVYCGIFVRILFEVWSSCWCVIKLFV